MKNQHVLGYIRVSTGDQQNSISLQESKIKAFCELNDYELVDIIIDEGVSGSVPIEKRKGGKKLLEQLQSDKFMVVSWKLDRMFRSAKDCLNTMDYFKATDTHVAFIDLNIDTSTPTGYLVLTMMSAVAELERNMISERITSILQHKKENKEVYSSAPYGFNVKKGKLVVNEKEMTIVRAMFEQKSSGVNLNKIARELNSSKVKSKKGGKWHRHTIKKIIDNDIYGNTGRV